MFLSLNCPALRELLEVVIPKMVKASASMREAAIPRSRLTYYATIFDLCRTFKKLNFLDMLTARHTL